MVAAYLFGVSTMHSTMHYPPPVVTLVYEGGCTHVLYSLCRHALRHHLGRSSLLVLKGVSAQHAIELAHCLSGRRRPSPQVLELAESFNIDLLDKPRPSPQTSDVANCFENDLLDAPNTSTQTPDVVCSSAPSILI